MKGLSAPQRTEGFSDIGGGFMPVSDALGIDLVLTVRGSPSDFRQVHDLDTALAWQRLFAVTAIS